MTQENKRIYTDIQEIPFSISIEERHIAGFIATKDTYKFRLTEHLRKLIDSTNNPGLKKQFLPSTDELVKSPTEFYNVSDDDHYEPVPYIIHRYPKKVLLFLTLNCNAYCRFCFRKEKLNNPNYKKFITNEQLNQAIDYISRNNIDEVIFSGGDPFFPTDKLIETAVDKLLGLSTVRIVRYHTRIFTFDPERITAKLISIISRKKTTFIVMHVNQVEEITAEMEKAINLCVDSGIPLFSQTALLGGVNDNREALQNLFEALVHLRVKPYYLFHSDPGHGLSHFRVKLEDGIKLYRSIYDRISGLAMPIYLFNIPGGFGHVILDLGNVKSLGNDEFELTNWEGKKITYKDY